MNKLPIVVGVVFLGVAVIANACGIAHLERRIKELERNQKVLIQVLGLYAPINQPAEKK